MINSHVRFQKKIIMPQEATKVSNIKTRTKPEGLLKILFKSYEDFCFTQKEYEIYYFDEQTKRLGFRLSKLLFETAILIKAFGGWESIDQKSKTELLFKCGDLIGQPITDIDSLNLMNLAFEQRYVFPLRRFSNGGVSRDEEKRIDYIEIWDIIPNYEEMSILSRSPISKKTLEALYQPTGNYHNVKIFQIWR